MACPWVRGRRPGGLARVSCHGLRERDPAVVRRVLGGPVRGVGRDGPHTPVSALSRGNAGGAIAAVVSLEDTEFQEIPVVEDLCALEMYSAGTGEVEDVGTAFELPTGNFTKLRALGSKQLCCAYPPPKRLVVFEPEPEEDDEEEDE